MITNPKLEDRSEHHYMGIRTQVPIGKLKKVIPKLLDELFAWLGKQNVEPADAPFVRYHVIDMEALGLGSGTRHQMGSMG
jgi:hypothetical protein